MKASRLTNLFLVVLIMPILVVTLSIGSAEAGPPLREKCNDGVDNDGDGDIDCDDSDCAGKEVCTGQASGEICNDGVDNDSDNLTDCADQDDCLADPACTTLTPRCSNQYFAEFRFADFDGDTLTNDVLKWLYEHKVDKVMVASARHGFRLDTGTSGGSNFIPIRFVDVDLSNFDVDGDGDIEGSPAGHYTVDANMFLDHYFGGLNFCSLCDPTDPTANCETIPGIGCYAGGEGDCWTYYPVERAQYQSQGKATLQFLGASRRVTYGGNRDGLGGWDSCGEPVVVTRIAQDTWTIEGSRACLIDDAGGFVPQPNSTTDGYSLEAPFLLTVTLLQ